MSRSKYIYTVRGIDDVFIVIEIEPTVTFPVLVFKLFRKHSSMKYLCLFILVFKGYIKRCYCYSIGLTNVTRALTIKLFNILLLALFNHLFLQYTKNLYV